MTRGFFVTGTGTGVGKTYVTAQLARDANARGDRVFAFKPIETGCTRLSDGRWQGGDQEVLAIAAGDWQTGELRSLYGFERPLAPLAAARHEQRDIDVSRIVAAFHVGAAGADLVLVEGAGGWRVPITDAFDMGGLAKLLGLPVVVVATATLGTINHTLLTTEAVRHDGCEIRAVVLSVHASDSRDAARENAAEIGRRCRCPVLLTGEDALLRVL